MTWTDRADLLELLLEIRRLGLGDLLLHRLGRAVHQILGLLQAEPGDLADHLDDLDLLVAGRRSGSRRTPSAPPPPPRAPPPPAAGAATATAAAADTPHFSCKSFESWAASSRVSVSSFSAISSMFVAMSSASVMCAFCVVMEATGPGPRLLRRLRAGPPCLSARAPSYELCRWAAWQQAHQLRHASPGWRPRSGCRSASRDGRSRERLRAPPAGQHLALDQSDLIVSAGLARTNVCSALATATGSCPREASPVGPLRCGLRESSVRALHGDAGEPVLDHLVLRRRALELLAQIGDLPDGEAAVLGEHRGLDALEPPLQRSRRFRSSRVHLRHVLALPRLLRLRLNFVAMRCVSTLMPGLIVDDSVIDRR